MIRWVQPRSFVPVHGEYGFLQAHAGLAIEVGVEDVHLVENGTWMELTEQGLQVSEKVDLSRFYFDGVCVGDAHMSISHTHAIEIEPGEVHFLRNLKPLLGQLHPGSVLH